MDKGADGQRWARKRHEQHGKFAVVKDTKNLRGFPNEKAYRNHKSEYFPEVVQKYKMFRKLKESLRKIWLLHVIYSLESDERHRLSSRSNWSCMSDTLRMVSSDSVPKEA